jgi:xanthine dehydrogenase accessory factor
MTEQAARLARRRAELDAAGLPYVHATVVRAQSPTSTWPGAQAVILADGTIEGFVGGQCAESSVRIAALDALESGEPVLLRILPDDAEAFPDNPGAQTVVNPCLSGGAIEMFVDSQHPPQRLVVSGDTPIADAIAAFADPLGFACDRETGPTDRLDGALAVIVSSHGQAEEETIRAALDAGVGFIGLVASARRGRSVLDELGLDEAEEARVHTPVGVEIGARTPAEIALSILAAVIRAVRMEGLAPAPSVGGEAPEATTTTAVDPICGMTVVAAPPTLSLEVDGTTHWFCNPGCREQFATASAGADTGRPG